MIKEMLENRHLPPLLSMSDGREVTRDNFPERRREMLGILEEMEYGKMPEKCGETIWAEVSQEGNICGSAVTKRVEITFPTPDGKSFTFPVSVTAPKSASAENRLPALVYISFGYHKYYPIEEVIEQNVIVAEMIMEDVALDCNEDGFRNLMAEHYTDNGKRGKTDTGKIGMWAFAASRVLDYLLSLDCVCEKHVGVMGHSRRGKTALWAGANDERFTHVFSNDSGCSGAAVTRHKVGETFPIILKNFPYWFCENFASVAESVELSENTSFDQHYLLACCCPRKVYVSSASLDEWADPVSEYLCCAAASPAWEIYGMSGFVRPNRLPAEWERFADGDIGYHLRPGGHFLSRHDWMRFIEFLKKA